MASYPAQHTLCDPFDCSFPACPALTGAGCAIIISEDKEMMKMQPTWNPGQDKLSPSGGLLNYQWNDHLLQMELDEMNLLPEAQQAIGFAIPLCMPHSSLGLHAWCRHVV